MNRTTTLRHNNSQSAIIAQRSTDLLNPKNMLEEFDQKFGSVERHVPPVVTRVEHTSNGEGSRSDQTTPTTHRVRRALPELPKPKRQTSTRSQSSRSQATKGVSFQVPSTSAGSPPTPRQSPRNAVSVLPLAGTHCRHPQATAGSSRSPYSRPKLVSYQIDRLSTLVSLTRLCRGLRQICPAAYSSEDDNGIVSAMLCPHATRGTHCTTF